MTDCQACFNYQNNFEFLKICDTLNLTLIDEFNEGILIAIVL